MPDASAESRQEMSGGRSFHSYVSEEVLVEPLKHSQIGM